jgi:hypothetical protein
MGGRDLASARYIMSTNELSATATTTLFSDTSFQFAFESDGPSGLELDVDLGAIRRARQAAFRATPAASPGRTPKVEAGVLAALESVARHPSPWPLRKATFAGFVFLVLTVIGTLASQMSMAS